MFTWLSNWNGSMTSFKAVWWPDGITLLQNQINYVIFCMLLDRTLLPSKHILRECWWCYYLMQYGLLNFASFVILWHLEQLLFWKYMSKIALFQNCTKILLWGTYPSAKHPGEKFWFWLQKTNIWVWLDVGKALKLLFDLQEAYWKTSNMTPKLIFRI